MCDDYNAHVNVPRTLRIDLSDDRLPCASNLLRVAALTAMSSLLKSFRSSGQATWIDDDEVDACSVCSKRIVAGLLSSNKHHCRQCGLIVCAACSKQKINHERTCDVCFEHIQRAQKCEKFFIPLLKKGTVFQKYPGSAGALQLGGAGVNPRYIFLNKELDAICWGSPAKQGQVKGSIKIQTITAVVPGCTTQAFIKARVPPYKVNLCFSIVSQSRTLDLEAPSSQIRDQWVTSIGEYTKHFKSKSPEERRMECQAKIGDKIRMEQDEKARKDRRQMAEALRAKYNLPKTS